MDIHYKTIVKISAAFLILTITYGVSHFLTHPYVEKPLVVYQKTRLEGIGMSLELIESYRDPKVSLPTTFNVGLVNVELGQRIRQLNKKHLFYCTLKPGDAVKYSFNSSDAVWFTVATCNEPAWNLKTEEIVIDEPYTITGQGAYSTDRETVICFRFKTEPPMTASITFEGSVQKYAFN